MMNAHGYEVAIESRIGDHVADIVARRDGESVAIEIETGKSDAMANIEALLKQGVARVIVVVLTATATDELRVSVGRYRTLSTSCVEILTIMDALRRQSRAETRIDSRDRTRARLTLGTTRPRTSGNDVQASVNAQEGRRNTSHAPHVRSGTAFRPIILWLKILAAPALRS